MLTNDDGKFSSENETQSLLRLVHIGILVSLLWKIKYFQILIGVHAEFPIIDPFFPRFFSSQVSLIAAYIVAVASSALPIFMRSKKMLLACGGASFVALSILCLHQSSFNDVTFLTCAWTSLWCLWLTSRLGESFETLYPRAAWLSHLILSLIFFGGAIGKLTPGYLSGEVLHSIYFEGRDFWTYNLMRESMSEDALRRAATWHSWMVVASELVCGFLWLMPRKVASIIAIVVLCGIALTNNVLLFSVVTCLIALALVGLHQPKQEHAAFESP